MSALRVLVVESNGHGGHAAYALGLTRGLRRSGAEAELLTSTALRSAEPWVRAELLPTAPVGGGFVARAAARALQHARNARRIARRARAGRYDVVHFQVLLPGVAARLIRSLRRRGQRVVVTAHNGAPHARRFARVRAVLDRAALDAADLVLVHGGAVERALRERGVSAPCAVVPHGVDASPPGNGTLPGELGAAAGRPLFLALGQLRRNKGLEVALEAFAKLRVRFPGAGLAIAGEPKDYAGAALEELRARAAAAGAALVARFLTDAEVEGLMRRCDALVLPYRRGFEAQSGVLLQACRFGKPVVASDVSDLGRQVAEDGVGLVVPPEDAGALAAALGRIAERPDAFDAALSAARGRYSWERVAELHLAEYEKGSGPFFAAEKGPDPFSVPA